MPTAARVAAMIDGDDHEGDLAIVCADCHDPLLEEEEVLMRKLLAAMHADGNMLALTAWAAEGNEMRYHSAPRCNAVGPRASMRSRCDPRRQATVPLAQQRGHACEHGAIQCDRRAHF